MAIISKGQAEMNSMIAERILLATAKIYIPHSADRVYKIGEEVLFYDGEGNIFEGSFIEVDCTGRKILREVKVELGDKCIVPIKSSHITETFKRICDY